MAIQQTHSKGGGPDPLWTVVWQGDSVAAATAMSMLEDHGLDVKKEDGSLTTCLFVHREDAATVQDLFVDWQM